MGQAWILLVIPALLASWTNRSGMRHPSRLRMKTWQRSLRNVLHMQKRKPPQQISVYPRARTQRVLMLLDKTILRWMSMQLCSVFQRNLHL